MKYSQNVSNFFILSLLALGVACSTPKPLPDLTAGEKRLCFIGDMGNGSWSQLKVATQLKNANCHHVFVVGDVIYQDGIKDVEDPLLKKLFTDIYAPVATSGNKPQFHIVLGNHDYAGNPAAWLDVPKKHPWVNFPHYYYLQKFDGVCAVGMDSNPLTSAVTADTQRQSAWLKDVHKKIKDCPLKILFAHHPYISPKRSAMGQLKEVYESHVVGKYDFVITGHDHILVDAGKDLGTHFLISGAGGKHDKKPGFLIIDYKYENKRLSHLPPHFHYVD